MNFKATGIPYGQTFSFSKLVLDYLSESEALQPFYEQFPRKESLEAIIKAKSAHQLNRQLLSDALQAQYKNLETAEALSNNIELLKQPNTFSVTTAHQPNIFTGPLYFVYKILHAIKLAEYCHSVYPDYNFVPVYYMGSEDADLDELGHIHLNGEKLVWDTKQTGAVGRMTIDNELVRLIDRIEAEIGIQPHGADIMKAVRTFYIEGANIQTATLGFVNHLFGVYGLVVVVPDSPVLKSVAIDLFKDELLNQRSSAIVAETAQKLVNAGYKAQAHGRDINLFYLKDTSERLRIERNGDAWTVIGSNIQFTQEKLFTELALHPERFSPNVILRGLFQEMILPNIIFVGGGGELAYWLELKGIFNHYKVPYPLLVLRNSFLIVKSKQAQRMNKLNFTEQDLFQSPLGLKNKWVKANSQNNLSTGQAQLAVKKIFESLADQADPIDPTLKRHIYALQKREEKNIMELGKKFLRAEKKNYSDAMRQIDALKQQLFPNNNLQERIDNILPYLACWGPELIATLYHHSAAFEQQLLVISER